MKLNRIVVTSILVFFSLISWAQYEVPPGYYLFPIRPGEINYLSGSMGELRGTHFHGGLDIKTGGVTGMKVYAAAEGYVSRIKITLGGYGNAIYIQHPNGTTTVYAHLKEFAKPYHEYVLKKQYQKESYTVDLFPEKGQFKVKKGDVIALSGNSGSSRGPHLHFEIRDKNHHVMDPQRFLFPELKDDIAPKLLKVAFITKSNDARINGEIGRFEFNVKNISGNYILQEPVHLHGKIGIEIYAYDKANGTRNRYGIPDVSLEVNGTSIFKQNIRKLSYGRMRNILVHTNYPVTANGGRRFNKLYVDDGNTLNFYETINRGYYNFDGSSQYNIAIHLKDPCGNSTWFKTLVNSKPPKPTFKKSPNLDKHENTVLVHVADTSRTLDFFANSLKYSLSPSYLNEGNAIFQWDLRNGLLDSVDLCDKVIETNYLQTFYPNQEANFYNHTVNLLFPRKALFDTLYLNYQYQYDSLNKSEQFKFKNYEDPLRQNVSVTLKPLMKYNKNYYRVYSKGRKKLNYIGGEWNHDNEITFRTRDLVQYTIAADSIPPTIKPLKVTSNEIKLKIEDELSGINSYRAELNGKWLLLTLDAKYGLLKTDSMDSNIPFSGELILEVKDNTGNLKYFQTKIQ